MRFNRSPRHSQTQADPFRLAGHQRLEDASGDRGRRARPGIDDLDDGADAGTTGGRQRDLDAAVGSGRLNGVADHVEHHVPKLAGVAVDLQRSIRHLQAQVDAGVLALRPKQGQCLLDDGQDGTALARPRPLLAQVDEAAKVGFHQRQLPQRHLQGFGVGQRAFRGVQLHRQLGAGDRVTQLMGQPARQLADQAQAFGLLHRFLQVGQAFRHVIHRLGQVAELVVLLRQRHRAEIPGRDLPCPTLQIANSAHQSLTDDEHQQDRGQPAQEAEH